MYIKIKLLIISFFATTAALLAQGRGGPDALQNAFSDGPPLPPGGGGGANPVAVPLDSDALVFLLFAGIVYLLYHYRKYYTQKEDPSQTQMPGSKNLIPN